METSVTLMPMINLRSLWIILGFVLVVGSVLMWILCRLDWAAIFAKFGNRKKKVRKPSNSLSALRYKTIKDLEKLYYQYNKEEISSRKAYMKMSKILRHFVRKVTGKPVTNLSLDEINKLGLPKLTLLIQDYYEPEFARKSSNDFTTSYRATRQVIIEWR